MNEIKSILEKEPRYRESLFQRGYIITNGALPSLNDYPFYGNFQERIFQGYKIRVHRSQHLAVCAKGGSLFVLIGNAVNPFDGEISEEKIIETIAQFGVLESVDSLAYINQLTGSFFLAQIAADEVSFLTDPAGMLFGCYGVIAEKLYISSHTMLAADLAAATKSEYINRLEKYRFFYKYGLFFPGDATQYQELKRILQNHITTYRQGQFSVSRFYPTQVLVLVNSEEAYQELLEDVVSILKRTMECYAKKYTRPAISLTGGMDSKTTLACTNGLYDKFRYYSYITMQGDAIDAEGAHKIAEHLGIDHTIYTVSESDEDFPDIDAARAVMEHNNGGYRLNPNDVRKREYFRCLCGTEDGFDVEVKSWVSEIARANYYKKFGLKRMPKHLSGRNMASMYKVFLTERRLCHETAQEFERFIQKTGFHDFPEGYDESDMYLWEFRYSAWGGIVITSEHSYSNEIVIPYNNRLLLNRMLQAPKEKRISDEFHEDLIRRANSKISEAGVFVTNWNETKGRMRMERMYFLLNSALPY